MSAVDPVFPVKIASQAEAEAGTLNHTRLWTPERIGQAVAALGGGGGSTLAASTTAGGTVENTTTETEVLSLSVASADFADGGMLVVTSAYDCSAYNSGVMTLKLKIEGTTIVQSGWDLSLSAGAPAYATLGVRLVRSGGTLYLAGSDGSIDGGSPAPMAAAVALSGDCAVSCTITWDTANAGNVASGLAATAFVIAPGGE